MTLLQECATGIPASGAFCVFIKSTAFRRVRLKAAREGEERVASCIMDQIREIQPELVMGHRFHVAKIKKQYTFIATHSNKKRKSTIRKVKKTTAILIERVEAIAEIAQEVVVCGTKAANTIDAVALINELRDFCSSFVQVVAQSRRVFNGEKVPASERIFSIFETHTELLMRGKAHKPVEFGHLVQIGQTKEKFISFYSVQEKSSPESTRPTSFHSADLVALE